MFRKALLAAVSLLPTAAHAEWQAASSKHFIVYANDTPEAVKAFTTRLERFDKAIRILRVVRDDPATPARRVSVYVLNDVDDVQKLMGGNANAAGFYIPRASGPVAFIPKQNDGDSVGALTSQAILMHEYAHHFMFSTWGDAAFPKWYTEGFAEFNATAKFNKDGSITLGAMPLYRTYGILDYNTLPAETLLKPNPGNLSREQTAVLYARGWLLTHYMTSDPARRAQLAAYVTAINAGKSIDEATAAFGNVGSLDYKLNTYVKKNPFPAFTIPVDQLQIGEVKLRPMTAGEAAVIPARLRSTRSVTDKTAPAVATLARQLAAPYPDDVAAQLELAEAEFDAKNFAASEAAADRALATDPKAIRALLYKGMAQEEIAKKDTTADPAKWQAIRRLFLSANKLDPDDPEPLIQFYDSFEAAKQKPPKSAEDGLLYAYAIAPYDPDLRLKVGLLLLRQDKPAAARVALRPVAYSPHGGGASATATKMLEALDAGGSAAALKVLDDMRAEAKRKAEEAKAKAGT